MPFLFKFCEIFALPTKKKNSKHCPKIYGTVWSNTIQQTDQIKIQILTEEEVGQLMGGN